MRVFETMCGYDDASGRAKAVGLALVETADGVLVMRGHEGIFTTDDLTYLRRFLEGYESATEYHKRNVQV